MRKKTVLKSKNSEPKQMLICPVCNKEFEVNGDTKYFIRGGYTCSWKCFLNEVKQQDARRQANGKYKDYVKRK